MNQKISKLITTIFCPNCIVRADVFCAFHATNTCFAIDMRNQIDMNGIIGTNRDTKPTPYPNTFSFIDKNIHAVFHGNHSFLHLINIMFPDRIFKCDILQREYARFLIC